MWHWTPCVSDAPSIGIVTVGQSPRADLERDFGNGHGVSVTIRGALDSLAMDGIEAMRPSDASDYPIRCQLRTGIQVPVSKQQLLPLVQRCSEQLEADGVDLIVIGCNSDFEVTSTRPVLHVGRAVNRVIYDLVGDGKLGCLIPLEAQVPKVEYELTANGVDGLVVRAAPSDMPDHVVRASRTLEQNGCTLIFLRCFGFGSEWQRRVAASVSVPVVSPVTLSAALSRSVVGADIEFRQPA